MKISLFLLFFITFTITANIYSQETTIDLQVKDISVRDLFKIIEDKSNVRFFYSNDLRNLNRIISLSAQNLPLAKILDQVLSDSNVSYKVFDNNIVVITPFGPTTPIKVKGNVTDDDEGKPLPGVSVGVNSTSQKVITDLNGNYTIEVANKEALLEFSFMGFETERIQVSNQSVINVKLRSEVKKLEEVVIIGYGSQKKADVTASVSSAKGDDLTKVSAANIGTAISGRLSGLQVTQESGLPGASVTFKERGVGSVYSDNSPLILIDGFKGDLNTVDVNDVESVTLLKDAASAAIYGSWAANGVVLITTKRGKNKPLKIEIISKSGYQWATHIPKFLNSVEWANKMNESTLNRKGIIYWKGDQAPELQTTNTNWFDYIFRKAPVSDMYVSATGGTEKLQYAVSLGYFDQDGILIGTHYKRFNLRANIDYITDKFTFGTNFSQFKSWYTNTNAFDGENDPILDAVRTPPTIPVLNPDGFPGTPRTGYPGEDLLLDQTPRMDAISKNDLLLDNTSVANLYSEIKLLKGLKYKAVFNINSTNNFYRYFKNQWYSFKAEDINHRDPYKANSIASLTEKSGDNFTWEVQNLLMYTLELKDHHVDALLGISAQKIKVNGMWASIDGIPRNDLLSLDAGNAGPQNGGGPSTSSISSKFGRVNYAFKNKYLAQVNIRRDGTSVFAPGHRWGVFPSASVGWRISDEDFLKNSPVIRNLKLRAGYGTLGNSNIPLFQWLSTVAFGGYFFGDPQTLVPTAGITEAYNENIQWEKTTTLNLGMDLGLVNNKLLITAEVFNRKTSNMLLVQPLPLTAGVFRNPFINIGGVDNRGWEFSLEYNNNFGNLNYGLSFNMTHVKNKVVDMGDFKPINELNTRTEQGHPINYYYGYQVLGIYQTQLEIDTTPKRKGIISKPGDYRYRDIDHNDTIDAMDRSDIGSAIPQFYYGASFFLNWKGIDVSFLLQGEFNKKFMMDPSVAMDFGSFCDYTNMYKSVYDKRWKGPGDQSYYPALGSGERTSDCNDRWVQNASYLRIKSIQLGYTLPNKISSKLHVQKLRIFLTGTNLFTFTKYPGFDPEIGGTDKRADGNNYMDKVDSPGGLNYPQAKVIQIGINIIL